MFYNKYFNIICYFVEVKERYKTLREECQISENAISVYEEPQSLHIRSAAHSFVYSEGFIPTELRSILLFVILGGVYYCYNRFIDRFRDSATFHLIITVLKILCSHVVDILICAWLIWIVLTLANY